MIRIPEIGRTMIAAALLLAPLIAQAERSGEEVYGMYCIACHGSGAPGIPQKGFKDDWTKRNEQGIDALTASVKNGKNAMPPMGLCNDCTDGELKAAAGFVSGATE